MFHMMNEARIGVGTAAVMLGMAGYYASLDYAKNRRRAGRRPAGKDPAQPQVRIIEHADVKRMLLAQKSIAKARWRWSCTARGWSTSSTPAARGRRRARLLLEVLTPIAKSWPSEWCLEANSLAIQVTAATATRATSRSSSTGATTGLNMIHEGTHGIQACDLLGRKVLMEDGAA
jgi:butyryl-CoA dehydrogenase